MALLLAGGGAPCRRQLATPAGVVDPEGALRDAGAPPPLMRSARRLERGEVTGVLESAAAAGWRWLVPGDETFPAALSGLSDPPLGLFVRGVLGSDRAVAVVGSRRATPYGRQVARWLGEQLARAGVVVVSGMARGIDAAAHKAALTAGGATWAVWGAGPDRVYPPEHRRLADEIAAAGALITEYPPGTPPRRHHFPERNRLIAGACSATVVVEAAVRSGALVTARAAIDEGREVFVVPGPVFSATSVGPNTLLRVGARPLLTPSDVVDVVGGGCRSPDPKAAVDGGDALLDHLPSGVARTADELAARSGLGVAAALARLLELELAGTVERSPDGRYARTRGMTVGDPGVCESRGSR